MHVHHAAESVRISASRVTAAPTICTIKHMLCVNASNFKCDFIIQSPMTFFPALTEFRNELEGETCHDEVGMPAVGRLSFYKDPDDVDRPRTSTRLKSHTAREDEDQHNHEL